MGAPKGAFVKIYYDGPAVQVGDCLRTPTGRVYVIMERRVQSKGKYIGRQHLGCVVDDTSPPGAHVQRLHWYKRGRSQK
jgi:hypothetical protein